MMTAPAEVIVTKGEKCPEMVKNLKKKNDQKFKEGPRIAPIKLDLGLGASIVHTKVEDNPNRNASVQSSSWRFESMGHFGLILVNSTKVMGQFITIHYKLRITGDVTACLHLNFGVAENH